MTDDTTRIQSGAPDRPFSVPADVPVLPLRDTVLFPNSFMPLAVARESSVKLIDEAIAGGKLIGVFTQRDPDPGGSRAGRPAPHRHADAHPQDVQAARRQPPAHRPGARAHPSRRSVAVDATRICAPRSREVADVLDESQTRRSRRAAAQRPRELPAGRAALARAVRRSDGARGEHHASGPARGLRRVEPDARSRPPTKQELLETPDVRARMDAAQPHPHQGARGPRARLEDPVAGPVRGRQEPARVLPARADEGDPEGARRGRRPGEGNRRAAREDRRGRHARGRQEGSAPRARSAVEDAGGRGRIHRRAHLHRLARRAALGEAHRRGHRSRARPRPCSTPITPASSARRTASSSTSRSAS